MRLTSLKSIGRAAMVAVALGSAALAAAPAMAQQPGPSLNFHIGPGGSGFSFGFGGGGPNWGPGPGPGPGFSCLSNSQVRQYLRSNGWRDVDIRNNMGNNRVRVTARWGGQWYEMRVHRCTGEVDRVRPIGGGGFGLQFGN